MWKYTLYLSLGYVIRCLKFQLASVHQAKISPSLGQHFSSQNGHAVTSRYSVSKMRGAWYLFLIPSLVTSYAKIIFFGLHVLQRRFMNLNKVDYRYDDWRTSTSCSEAHLHRSFWGTSLDSHGEGIADDAWGQDVLQTPCCLYKF